MKHFLRIKDKIKLLSDVTGLPVYYASDLNIIFEGLESYDGKRFLLILRTSGAQLCLLDDQTNEYRAQKLSEFKFYFAQCRDAITTTARILPLSIRSRLSKRLLADTT